MEYPENCIRTVYLTGEKHGEQVCVRPARPDDIPQIRLYIGRMADHDDERYMRYLSTVSISTLIDDRQLEKIYDESLDYDQHMVFVVVTASGRIIGVAHAYGPCQEEDGRYEVSYSRDYEYMGMGVGTVLMKGLLSWGDHVGIKGFYADTLGVNKRMKRLFIDFGFALISPHPSGDRALVRYRYDMYAT